MEPETYTITEQNNIYRMALYTIRSAYDADTETLQQVADAAIRAALDVTDDD